METILKSSGCGPTEYSLDCVSKYILDGHTPVKEPDLMKWARWMEPDRHVALSKVRGFIGVSTVFLGLDYNYTGFLGAANGCKGNEPILFETMVFGGKHDSLHMRYHTWDEAMAGHRWLVQNLWFKRIHWKELEGKIKK